MDICIRLLNRPHVPSKHWKSAAVPSTPALSPAVKTRALLGSLAIRALVFALGWVEAHLACTSPAPIRTAAVSSGGGGGGVIVSVGVLSVGMVSGGTLSGGTLSSGTLSGGAGVSVSSATSMAIWAI